jgi:hypothetical protein
MRAQYRFLPALQWARRQILVPHHEHARSAAGTTALHMFDWVAMVDDDSFVFPRRLRSLLAAYDPSEPLHLGDFWHDDNEPGGRHAAPQYACGGGGSVFSRGALERLDVRACMRTAHGACAQSDWMLGECARTAGVRLVPRHGCTCVRWHENTEARVRGALRAGSCAFLQFPGKLGARGGPFKDLVPLLKSGAMPPPAVVHQLERLV